MGGELDGVAGEAQMAADGGLWVQQGDGSGLGRGAGAYEVGSRLSGGEQYPGVPVPPHRCRVSHHRCPGGPLHHHLAQTNTVSHNTGITWGESQVCKVVSAHCLLSFLCTDIKVTRTGKKNSS